MKTIFKILVYFCCILGYAQVGIGTTTPNAQLDIQSTNQANPSNTDGILIPKIDVFPATNPGANQNGMLVFLTTTVGTNVPGFYYWNHPTAWVPIGNNSNSGWSLNGNSGTIPGTNFIGTTDDRDLVFKRNNFVFGKLGFNTTSFGRNTNISGSDNSAFGSLSMSNANGNNNSAFGVNTLVNSSGSNNNAFGRAALFNNTIGESNSAFGNNALVMNTTGSNNSAFGDFVMSSNVSGSFNSAFGYLSLSNNTTGGSNSAFGRQSLASNVDGFNNSAFGRSTLLSNISGDNNSSFGDRSLINNTTGEGNSAFGFQAMETNTTGDFNSIIGSNADVAVNNLTNATAIGAFSEVATSNSLVLGSINGINGATADVNVGIGTTSPSRRLHVVNSGSSGGTPFGTAGFVLESNLQVYQQFLTPSNRESGLLFGNESSNIRAGILFNSGHPDGLSFRTGGNTTRMAITNAGDMGMGTLAPQAAMDIIANDNGVLIPRVILTAANVQAPVVNPTGGALPESTLVYNTNSSGTVPNDVTPGFYYWQNNRWNRLGNENKTRYYTAVGTTNSEFFIGSAPSLVPEMSITFTPTSSTVLVNFNASGRLITTSPSLISNTGIESVPVAFRLVLNNTFVRTFFTMTDNGNQNEPIGIWEIDYNYPITVQPGVSQTISIEYQPLQPTPFVAGDRVQSFVNSVFTFFSVPVQHHRVLTVIDP